MKKYRTIIIIVALMLISLILIAILRVNMDNSISMEPYEGQELIYLGNEDTDNELLFMFDYACPWCAVWVDEILPELESDYIDTGELKLRTQAMVYVNDAALRLANFDQNIKQHAPDQYHQIYKQIIADTPFDQDGQSNWGAEEYIQELIESYQLDEADMLRDPLIDANELSQVYTQALTVETVPSVYVNGVKVEDPFDLDEIVQLIK